MVYLDPVVNYGWRLGPSCHMIADTLEELHQMAARIGLRRSWFQDLSKASFPHYDLTVSKRALAIKHGASALNRRDFVMKMRELRSKPLV